MRPDRQLDLFSASADRVEQDPEPRPRIALQALDDDSLIAGLSNAGMRDSVALASEAGRRRLAAAVPALEALCRRFAGFGADRIVPEQAAALDALAMIGGTDAANAAARMIARNVVQGPSLQKAVATAAALRARLSAAAVLRLLRHDDPRIRADVCRCARPWPDAIPVLCDLLGDRDPDVRAAAACALAHMGRGDGRRLLARQLCDAPSAEIIDAVAAIADEDCMILLGRVARSETALAAHALDALDAIDHPRAAEIADGARHARGFHDRRGSSTSV